MNTITINLVHVGESKNYYIYEPTGPFAVGKLYIDRKQFTSPIPARDLQLLVPVDAQT
jgi:hypothetical protein